MKTIIKGKTASQWVGQVKCPHCHSLLEIRAKDIWMYTQKTRRFLFFSELEECYEVRCRECKTDIILNSDDVPGIVRDYLLRNMSTGQFLLNYYFNN